MAANLLPQEESAARSHGGLSDLSSSEAKTTAEVIDLARAFVERRFLGTPGFRGAHLVGSINHTDPDAPFPTYRDVDVAIVLDSVEYQEIEEVLHEGYVLECILSGSSRYRGSEDILSKPGMACNLEKNSILVDPEGHLTRIHQEVAAGFAKRQWVRKRVEAGLADAMKALEAMAKSANVAEAVNALGEFIMHCSECITVAHLEPPTHRRTLANLKIMMQSPEELALHEQILETFGSAHLTEEEVRTFLRQCVEAFDRALEVKKSSVPFEWKLDPCIRDYLDVGTQEMIDEGSHREAIFWIALFFMISTLAIQQDGEQEEKAVYGARLKTFLHALGLESPEHMAQRFQACTQLHAKVADYVERFISESAELED